MKTAKSMAKDAAGARARYASLTPEERAARIKRVNLAQAKRRAAEAAREDLEIAHAEALAEDLSRKRDKVALERLNLATDRLRADFMAFYRERFASYARCRETGKRLADSLGRIHDWVADFTLAEHHRNPELPWCMTYSPLVRYMPAFGADGFQERWLWFRTMDSAPVIQDGPVGPVSQMYLEKPWQGMLFRFCGWKYKCFMLPRGHLKSELVSKAHTAWKIAHDPSLRYFLQSTNDPQGKKLMTGIKFPFEKLARFRELYGHLAPETGDKELWSQHHIQLKSSERAGTDPTVEVAPIGGDRTGSHVNGIILDDVVSRKTIGGKDGQITERTNEIVRMMQGILDTSATLWDVGTPWADNDAHSLFVRPGGAFYPGCSFMMVTLIDDDPNGSVPASYGISGAGNPVYPEKFPASAVVDLRSSMPVDKEYFGQFFCQFTGTTEKIFSSDWITHYDGRPEEICDAEKCNVFVAVDTAGKDTVLKKGKFDPTGIIVLGQSSLDPTRFFILDGIKERMAADDVADAIVDTCVYWQKFTEKHGTIFKAGFEETIYTTFIEPLIKAETIRRGIEGQLNLQVLKHGNRAKEARIRILATPYSRSWIAWPRKLVKKRFGRGEPYDLTEALRAEFVAYPMVAHEELLDCTAYAFELAGDLRHEDRPLDPSKVLRKDSYVRRKWKNDEETGEIVSDEPDGVEYDGPPGYEGDGWQPGF